MSSAARQATGNADGRHSSCLKELAVCWAAGSPPGSPSLFLRPLFLSLLHVGVPRGQIPGPIFSFFSALCGTAQTLPGFQPPPSTKRLQVFILTPTPAACQAFLLGCLGVPPLSVSPVASGLSAIPQDACTLLHSPSVRLAFLPPSCLSQIVTVYAHPFTEAATSELKPELPIQSYEFSVIQPFSISRSA